MLYPYKQYIALYHKCKYNYTIFTLFNYIIYVFSKFISYSHYIFQHLEHITRTNVLMAFDVIIGHAIILPIILYRTVSCYAIRYLSFIYTKSYIHPISISSPCHNSICYSFFHNPILRKEI